MIRGMFIRGDENLEIPFLIRDKVFCEAQGMSKEYEFDKLDQESLHVLVFDGENPVATGRLYQKNDYFKIGRIAVLSEHRGKQFGDFVVRMLVDKAFTLGAKEVWVGAQVRVIKFYESIGFIKEGNEYIEEGILHVNMKIIKGGLCKGCCSTH